MVYLLFNRPPISGRRPIRHRIMDERRLSARNTAEVVAEVISIAFEVTTFGFRRGKICHERAISVMSRLAPVYTIYGLLPATSSLEAKPGEPTRASHSIELARAPMAGRAQAQSSLMRTTDKIILDRGPDSQRYETDCLIHDLSTGTGDLDGWLSLRNRSWCDS
jgi:hypothetical protein